MSQFYDIRSELKQFYSLEIYKYDININNLGLVQDQDLQKDIPSILFLGDSFTEGQGGDGSWINFFGGNYNNYQIINGGLLGTGFQQFELLNSYLSNHNIKKVFVLLVPTTNPPESSVLYPKIFPG